MQAQAFILLKSDGDNLRWGTAFDVYRIHVTMVETAAQKPGSFNLQGKRDLNIISNTICSLQNDCRLLKQNLFYSAL
jgi:hypothetical protein